MWSPAALARTDVIGLFHVDGRSPSTTDLWSFATMTNSKSSEPDQHAGAVGATRRCYRGAWRAACWDGQVFSPNVLSVSFRYTPTWRRRTRAQVLLVAGGIGITPMRALFETLDVAGSDLTLLYRASTLLTSCSACVRPDFGAFPPTLGAVVCSCTRNRSRPVTSTLGLPPVWLTLGVGGSQAASAAV